MLHSTLKESWGYAWSNHRGKLSFLCQTWAHHVPYVRSTVDLTVWKLFEQQKQWTTEQPKLLVCRYLTSRCWILHCRYRIHELLSFNMYSGALPAMPCPILLPCSPMALLITSASSCAYAPSPCFTGHSNFATSITSVPAELQPARTSALLAILVQPSPGMTGIKDTKVFMYCLGGVL